jgi:hypothetical protein
VQNGDAFVVTAPWRAGQAVVRLGGDVDIELSPGDGAPPIRRALR